jgi:hypothetical protein
MGYFGMIELVVVLAFAAGWGIVELVGMRLDKEKAAHKGTRKTAKRKTAAKKRRK